IRRRLARAIALGTTTIEVKSGYGLEPAEELRQLRVIAAAAKGTRIDVAVTYLALHALPAARAEDRRGFVREAAQAVRTVADEGLAEAVDAFVENGVFDVEDVRPHAARGDRGGDDQRRARARARWPHRRADQRTPRRRRGPRHRRRTRARVPSRRTDRARGLRRRHARHG